MSDSHRRATYASTETLFATLAAHGVADVVVSPGSRSTPLAVTAAAISDLSTHVVLDERSAGFVALGMAVTAERPVALVCTSGTAAANYLPAVVEANRGRVPLVVITADRPLGFLERDAPQTIDQIGLYGAQARWSSDLIAAHLADPDDYSVAAIQAIAAAVRPNAGPVHINVPFEKPLEPEPGWAPSLQVERSTIAVGLEETPNAASVLRDFVAAHERGVVVVGSARLSNSDVEAVALLAGSVGWPVLADPLSNGRMPGRPEVVTAAELLLRDPDFVGSHVPEAVIRLGGRPTGRATLAWLDDLDVPTLIVDPDDRWTASGPTVLRASVDVLFAEAAPAGRRGWFDSWQEAERNADQRRTADLAAHPDSEPAVTRRVLAAAPGPVWVASSMPVRHVDVMTPNGYRRPIYANRGANGIDGSIASAVGAALASGERVTAIVGDLAFLHDVGSLNTAVGLGVDLTLVVLDNQGGAIFKMLPVATHDDVEFERFFTTPQHRDLVAIAAAFDTDARRAEAEEIDEAVADGTAGVRVLVVPTDATELFDAYDRMAGT